MKSIELANKLTMCIEPQGKKVRLIIKENGKELACRKENIKKLQHFLSSDEATIFKGGLQLYKTNNQINIRCKSESIGIIAANQFTTLLPA